jgi:ribosomal protein S18 acetylase RimI-like enzyme
VDAWPRDPADSAERRFIVDLYVHPHHRATRMADPSIPSGQALGRTLMERAIARARERLAAEGPAGGRGRLLSGVAGTDPSGQQLHLSAGYRQSGESWIMRVEHAAPPPAPQWPEGVKLRPLRPGVDERIAHGLINDTFSDLTDYRQTEYESWAHRMHKREGFDPRYWFMAWSGDTLAGAALCFLEGSKGWVGQIGVRKPWRRQGLGLALLHHAFGEFYAAGVPAVELGVDAANATGAWRVYERAGMSISRRYVRFEKEI